MSETRKVVINRQFGGFGLSEAAYEWLIAHGVPVRKYVENKRGEDGRYLPESANEGEIIFDRELTLPGESGTNDRMYHAFKPNGLLGRYWETWIGKQRHHPLLVQVVEALGAEANGMFATLEIVEIPADVEYEVEEYDGMEHIAETHRRWP